MRSPDWKTVEVCSEDCARKMGGGEGRMGWSVGRELGGAESALSPGACGQRWAAGGSRQLSLHRTQFQ